MAFFRPEHWSGSLLLESSPSGSGSTQGMSGEEGDRHTQKVAWKKKLFLFLGQLSFYRMNITSPLSHHILHLILVLCFCQYFFPHVSPLCIRLEHFRLQGFFLNVPYISLLASMA